MKRCPKCRRDYYDETLLYCLDDGSALLDGPASGDESVTAVFGERELSPSGGESRTHIFRSGETRQLETGNQNSIAVLPFTNMSADPDNEYFCDGLAEELINALSKLDELKVAARTSAFSFRGMETDITEIAKKLGVKTVLEGSVRKSREHLRITAQLINAADGYHLWSERYDREMKDIFDVQDEITLAVVEALKVKLLGASKAEVLKHHTDNTEAYKSYLRGRYLRLTKNDHAGAMHAFEEAVRLDPAHAPSWVGVAEGTVLAAHYALIPARAACAKAKRALQRARELQGESAESFYVEGFIGFIERNWSTSETLFRKGIELGPRLIHPLGSFGLTLCAQKRFADAESVFERARDLDPLSSFPYAITGVGRVIEGRLEESLELFDQAFAFEQENAMALWGNCIASIALEKFDAGITAAESGVRVSRRAAFFLGLLGWALARAGRRDDARTALSELRSLPAETPLNASQAWLVSELGEMDDAYRLLEQAIDEHQPFTYYAGLPTFDRFRDHPRFGELMRSMGLPE